jgi:hypothetical protein
MDRRRELWSELAPAPRGDRRCETCGQAGYIQLGDGRMSCASCFRWRHARLERPRAKRRSDA